MTKPVVIHPEWEGINTGSRGDVALIPLQGSFEINRYVQTAALADNKLATGELGRVASILEHGGGTAPPGWTSGLVVYEAPVVAVAGSCSSTFPYELCAQAATSAVCKGDSGSGFTYVETNGSRHRATVAGIASFTALGECEDGDYVGMADVSYNKPWILDALGMDESQLGGNVRMTRTGLSSGGTMKLECFNSNLNLVTAEGPMDVVGAEIGLDCFNTEVTATCDLQGLPPDREIRTFIVETSSGPSELAHSPTFAEDNLFTLGIIPPRVYECRVDMPIALYVAAIL